MSPVISARVYWLLFEGIEAEQIASSRNLVSHNYSRVDDCDVYLKSTEVLRSTFRFLQHDSITVESSYNNLSHVSGIRGSC